MEVEAMTVSNTPDDVDFKDQKVIEKLVLKYRISDPNSFLIYKEIINLLTNEYKPN